MLKSLTMRLFLRILLLLLTICTVLFTPPSVQAIYDPLSVPNNKFGIHLISADTNEASEAASLVNPNGDWGYITLLVEQKDRNESKWQQFFNELRRRHLIPIVRIASKVEGNSWKVPGEDEAQNWADFLDKLIWPVKNRYVIIYNEPNHALEWGNYVDAKSYAKILDQTIAALKNKNSDFFVLNAGLDASAPEKLPAYQDELEFLKQVNQSIPGIFDRLDGWVSHSYPNPEFSGPVSATGRGTVRTWQWEAEALKNLGLKKELPIFITETGWKHAEGLAYNPGYLSSDAVGQNFKRAFLEVWKDHQIVAVTPFVLDYQEDPFEHFSFKKPTSGKQRLKLLNNQVLGTEFPDFFPQYQIIRDLPKTTGSPIQESRAEIKESNFYNTVAVNQEYVIYVKVKNMGQSIWGEKGEVKLVPIKGGTDLGLEEAKLPAGSRIEPGQEYTFQIKVKPTKLGDFRGALALFEGGTQFSSEPFYFTTQVKSPVILNVKAKLAWKNSSAGGYILNFITGFTQIAQKIVLGLDGTATQLQLKNVLPDTEYDFTLSRPHYQPKKIHQRVISGENTLDFGELQPDLPSTLFNPPQLWKLLPLSNP